MERIGVLLPTWIGDTCMATPMLRALRKGFPSSHLTVVGRPILLELLCGATADGGGPLFDSTLRFDKKASFSRLRLGYQLRRLQLDCFLLTPNAFWAGMAANISRAKRTVGYGRDGRSWLLTDPVPLGESKSSSQIEAYLGISHWIGCDQGSKQMCLGVTPDEAELAKQLWQVLQWSHDCPTLLINNNTALDRRRVWPADRVEAIARHASERGWQVLLHCGPSERAAADATAGRLASPLVASMGVVADLPIGLTKSVMDCSALVITTDSGPRHIAAALDRRIISLFGPTDPKVTETFNVAETVLAPLGPDQDSMQAIELERVLSAFDQVADEGSQGDRSNQPQKSEAS